MTLAENETEEFVDKEEGKCLECISAGKAVPGGNCTMCYRCVNHCPNQALTILGEDIIEQSIIDNYI